MLSSSARSTRDDPACWIAIRDIDEPRRDATVSVLARAAAQGHRLAQRELFRRLALRVHETLHAILGNDEQMELHLQNAFVEIFRSIPSYDRHLDLDTWACTIAVRCARRDVEAARAPSR